MSGEATGVVVPGSGRQVRGSAGSGSVVAVPPNLHPPTATARVVIHTAWYCKLGEMYPKTCSLNKKRADARCCHSEDAIKRHIFDCHHVAWDSIDSSLFEARKYEEMTYSVGSQVELPSSAERHDVVLPLGSLAPPSAPASPMSPAETAHAPEQPPLPTAQWLTSTPSPANVATDAGEQPPSSASLLHSETVSNRIQQQSTDTPAESASTTRASTSNKMKLRRVPSSQLTRMQESESGQSSKRAKIETKEDGEVSQSSEIGNDDDDKQTVSFPAPPSTLELMSLPSKVLLDELARRLLGEDI